MAIKPNRFWYHTCPNCSQGWQTSMDTAQFKTQAEFNKVELSIGSSVEFNPGKCGICHKGSMNGIWTDKANSKAKYLPVDGEKKPAESKNAEPKAKPKQSEIIKERSHIATSEKPSANLSVEWFAKSGYLRRANNEITPLINGEAAFAAVATAISGAKKSIDIVSWGFDASMRFKRPGGDRIGELLRQKGKEGVKVRILIWRNKLVQAAENTVPGANQFSGQIIKDAGMSGMNRLLPPKQVDGIEVQQARDNVKNTQTELFKLEIGPQTTVAENLSQFKKERENKIAQLKAKLAKEEAELAALEAKNLQKHTEEIGYGSGPSGKIMNSAGAVGDPGAISFNREWHSEAQSETLKNVEFRTRDFSKWDRAMIAKRQLFDSADQSPFWQNALMAAFPSHHQKMVVVDYEQPATAVGFVMGHNMHDNYWDTSEHKFNDSMGLRVEGFGPWQDLSTRVLGSVIFDLNTNFCEAWDKGSPLYKRWFDPLKGDRDHIEDKQFVTNPEKMRSMAQICRTQPQAGGEQAIRELYMNAAGNARRYIYVENQYFRYPPWADEIKKMRKKLLAAGRSEQEHGVCHIFVVTNVPDKSGRMRTSEMLDKLGRSDRMPQVYREENKLASDKPVQQSDVAGLKMHICTLVTDTEKSANNSTRSIYVHSKLLVVDDAFFTLGSANINTRSLESDSELNIASDDPLVARQWREKLFALHTGRGASEEPADEFAKWKRITDSNQQAMQSGKPLLGKLIEFFDGGGAATALD